MEITPSDFFKVAAEVPFQDENVINQFIAMHYFIERNHGIEKKLGVFEVKYPKNSRECGIWIKTGRPLIIMSLDERYGPRYTTF